VTLLHDVCAAFDRQAQKAALAALRPVAGIASVAETLLTIFH